MTNSLDKIGIFVYLALGQELVCLTCESVANIYVYILFFLFFDEFLHHIFLRLRLNSHLQFPGA